MKKLLLGIILITGLTVLSACQFDSQETVLTQGLRAVQIDINPSIELLVDEDGIVISYQALNADAEIVIADLDLIGMHYDDAINAYLEAAIDLGYLDANAEDNAVVVTVAEEACDEDECLELKVQEMIQLKLQEKGIPAAVMRGNVDSDVVADLLENYDISNVKARVIARILNNDADADVEALVELNVPELMEILRDYHHASMDEFIENRQEMVRALHTQILEAVQSRMGNSERPDVSQSMMAEAMARFNTNENAMRGSYRARINALRDAVDSESDEDSEVE